MESLIIAHANNMVDLDSTDKYWFTLEKIAAILHDIVIICIKSRQITMSQKSIIR